MNRGFTLVEILVVIAVIAIIGTIMVAIFANTLRGSNKAQVLSVIKQNGQAVLENMDKTVRGADDVICPARTTPTSTNLVVIRDGIYTRYRFIAPTATDNGLIQQDNPVKQIIQGSNPPTLESDNTFLTRICNPNDPVAVPDILTDTNTQIGVSVANGLFTRSYQPGFKDIVTVEFTLGPGVKAPSTIAGQIDPAIFQTTVQLR